MASDAKRLLAESVRIGVVGSVNQVTVRFGTRRTVFRWVLSNEVLFDLVMNWSGQESRLQNDDARSSVIGLLVS